jgi:hypothetical protein
MDEPQMLKLFLHNNKTVYDYEKEMVESGIPSIVIEKMKVKNNDNILLTIDLVEVYVVHHFITLKKID